MLTYTEILRMTSFLKRYRWSIGIGLGSVCIGYGGYMLYNYMKEKLNPATLLTKMSEELEKEEA